MTIMTGKEIDYQKIESITSKELITEFKSKINRLTNGPFASEVHSIGFNMMSSTVLILVDFHTFYLSISYDERSGYYTMKTISFAEYALIKKLTEGGE